MPALPATQFFTAEDGAQLAYLDQGTGPVVLCLAGLTRGKEDFDEAMPALDGARVIRMDYRGRGESSYSGAASYTIAQEAKDALALLDHLGLAQAGVLGTSRGGLIGMYLAGRAKQRLTGLCLVDIGPEIDPAGLALIRDYIGRRPAAKTLEALALKLPQVSAGFAAVAPAQWQAMAARLYRQTPEGLELRYDPDLRQIFAEDFTQPADQWDDFRAAAGLPLAVIRGANSNLFSRDCLQRMQALRPDMLVAEVPDRGHVPFLDEAQSSALLRGWLCHLPSATA